MKFSINKILSESVLLLLLVIATISLISIWKSRQTRITAEYILQGELSVLQMQRLISSAPENETGARSYMITGEEGFLPTLNKPEPGALVKLAKHGAGNQKNAIAEDSSAWYFASLQTIILYSVLAICLPGIIISNAPKYSSHKEQSPIGIGSSAPPGETVFYVKDNGVGFDKRYKNKLRYFSGCTMQKNLKELGWAWHWLKR